MANAAVNMAASSLSFASIPYEIWLKIFAEVDVETAIALSNTRLSLTQIFKREWASILHAVLSRDFAPFDNFLRLNIDLIQGCESNDWAVAMTRCIYFENRLVSTDETPGELADFHFQPKHLGRIIGTARAVKRWELVFPRLRFARAPAEERRSLLPRENERLRHALYFWWRHTLQPPDGLLDDRWKGRMELAELPMWRLFALSDLLLSIQAAVVKDLYLFRERFLYSEALTQERHQYGFDPLCAMILRLAPDTLLWYFDNHEKFHSREHMLQDVRLRCPSILRGASLFEHDIEMFIASRLRDWDSLEAKRPDLAVLRAPDGPKLEGPSDDHLHFFPALDGGILDYKRRSQAAKTTSGRGQAKQIFQGLL